jgi:hypothetical protein
MRKKRWKCVIEGPPVFHKRRPPAVIDRNIQSLAHHADDEPVSFTRTALRRSRVSRRTVTNDPACIR